MDSEELIRQLATNAGDYAVGAFGQHLDKYRQMRLWKRHYDSVLAALITFQQLQQPNRTRAFAHASVN